jgi:type I restriction enzyme, S subunit
VSSSSWNRVPLTAVCATEDDIKCGPFGTQLNKAEFREEGVPLWGIKQVNAGFAIPTKEFLEPRTAKRLRQYDLRPGDIVMTRKGTVGNCAVYPQHFEVGIMHSDLLRLRIDAARCEPSFLVHQLHHSPDVERQLSLISGGAIMPGINVGRLKQLEVVLPPLAEQRRIAEVLDRAAALRAKRRAALAQLDSLTQAIFLEMFGDPMANEHNWPLQAVGDFVAGFESGKSLVADDEDDTTSPYRVLKVSAVTSLEYRPEQSKALPPNYTPPASHIVRTGDLLFSRANTSELIGATAYVFSTPANLLLPDKLWRFIWHDEPRADSHFVRHLFQQPKFRREIAQRASGTSGSMKNISQDKVLTIRTGLPPLRLQRDFARRVTAVEAMKTANRASLAELDGLFASLQYRAFRGEL